MNFQGDSSSDEGDVIERRLARLRAKAPAARGAGDENYIDIEELEQALQREYEPGRGGEDEALRWVARAASAYTAAAELLLMSDRRAVYRLRPALAPLLTPPGAGGALRFASLAPPALGAGAAADAAWLL
jgi:hypothetical protein